MHRDDVDRRLKTLGIWLHGLGMLVVLTLVLSGVCFVYGPIERHIADDADRADELQGLLQGEARVRAEHARLSKELAAAKKEAVELNSRIPDDPREADFLAQVSRLADDVGLQIQDYRPGAIVSNRSYSTMQVDLICEGDYTSICNFVDRLAELPRFSTVVQLHIEPGDEEEQYATKLTLKLYFGVKGIAHGASATEA